MIIQHCETYCPNAAFLLDMKNYSVMLSGCLSITIKDIQKGEEFSIKVGCPNMIERVEGNLLSYGNEMTNKDFPHDCGLGKYCNLESDYDFIGKTALLKLKEK